MEGDDISLSAYDSYISEDGVSFVLDHDGFESSNDLEMTYTRDSNGKVTLADVLLLPQLLVYLTGLYIWVPLFRLLYLAL